MKTYLFLGLFFLTVAVSTCKKSPDTNKKVASDVYVSGYIINSATGLDIATYWKNGIAIQLAGSSNFSHAQSIVLSGNVIYVVGYTTAGNGKFVATLWKNSILSRLSDTSTNSVANAITVVGNDVYIVGDMMDKNDRWTPHYWKNGIDIPLPLLNGTQYESARAICISGQDVYVCGYTSKDNSNVYATYWKNGIETTLTQISQASAEAISVINNDIYLAGYVNHAGYNTAIYWKNGVPVDLSDSSVVASASSMTIKGSYIYVAGITQNLNTNLTSLTYWKNTVGSTPLKVSKPGIFADRVTGVDVDGDDIYVAGSVNQMASYWKNGNYVSLGIGAAYGIAVVSH
jgi:hypothetical protein